MKKQILISTTMLLSSYCYAQKEAKQCEINVYQPGFKRYIMEVNYMGSHSRKPSTLHDTDGKVKMFESRLDAVEYMTKDGWEVVSVTTAPHRGNATRYYLRRK